MGMEPNKPLLNAGVASPDGFSAPKEIDALETTSSKGDVRTVLDVGKQIPQGENPEQKLLKCRQVDSYSGIPPKIRKPSALSDTGIAGELTAQAVLDQLQKMEPSVSADTVRRVSESRKDEMVERFQRVQAALGKKPIQAAIQKDLLDLGSSPQIDITLNAVMALALQVRGAENGIQSRVNADNRSAAAWRQGFKDFRSLQEAWGELHAIVTDICSHEPLATKIGNPKPTPSPLSDDLMSFSLIGSPLIPPKPSDEQVTRLEQDLSLLQDQLSQLKQPQESQELAQKADQIEQLKYDGVQLSARHAELQQQVSQLKEDNHNVQFENKELQARLSQEKAEANHLRKKNDQQQDKIYGYHKKQAGTESLVGEVAQLRRELDKNKESEEVALSKLQGAWGQLEEKEYRLEEQAKVYKLLGEKDQEDWRQLEDSYHRQLEEKDDQLNKIREDRERDVQFSNGYLEDAHEEKDLALVDAAKKYSAEKEKIEAELVEAQQGVKKLTEDILQLRNDHENRILFFKERLNKVTEKIEETVQELETAQEKELDIERTYKKELMGLRQKLDEQKKTEEDISEELTEQKSLLLESEKKRVQSVEEAEIWQTRLAVAEESLVLEKEHNEQEFKRLGEEHIEEISELSIRYDNSVDDFENERGYFKGEIIELNNQLRANRKEILSIKMTDKIAELTEQAETDKRKFEEKIQEHESRAEQLEKNVIDQQEIFKALEDERTKQSEEYTSLSDQLSDTEGKLDKEVVRGEGLLKKVFELEEGAVSEIFHREELEDKLEQQELKLEGHRAELASAEQGRVSLQDKLRLTNEKSLSLEKSLDASQTKVNELEAKAKEEELNLGSLNEKITELEEEVGNLKDLLSTNSLANDSVNQSTEKLSYLENQLKDERNKLAELNNAHDEKLSKMSVLQAALDNEVVRGEGLLKKVFELKEGAVSEIIHREELEDKLEQQELKLEGYKAELASAEQGRVSLQDKLRLTNEKSLSLEKSLDASQTKVNELEAKAKEEELNLESLNEKITELEEEVGNLKGLLLTKEVSASSVEQSRQALDEQLRQLKSEHKISQQSLKYNEMERKRLEIEVTLKENKLSKLTSQTEIEKREIEDKIQVQISNSEQLEMEILNQQEKFNDLEAERIKQSEESSSLSNQVLDSEKKVKHLEEELKGYKDLLDEANATNSQYTASERQAVDKARSLENKLKDECQKLDKLKRVHHENLSEMQDLNTSLHNAIVSKKGFIKKVSELEEDAVSKIFHRKELEAKLEQQKLKLEEHKTDLASAEQGRVSLQDKLRLGNDEKDSLIVSVSSAKEEIEKFELTVKSLVDEKQSLNTEVDNLRETGSSHNAQVKKLEAKIYDMTLDKDPFSDTASKDDFVKLYAENFKGHQSSSDASESSDELDTNTLGDMVERTFNNLTGMDFSDTTNTRFQIAYKDLNKNVSISRAILSEKIVESKERDQSQTFSSHEDPPSHRVLRKSLIDSYSLFIKDLEVYKAQYLGAVGKPEQYHSDRDKKTAVDAIEKVSTALALTHSGVQVVVQDAVNRQKAFENEVDKYRVLLGQDKGDNPEQAVHSTHSSMYLAMTATKSKSDQEVRDYIACSFAKGAVAVLKESFNTAIGSAESSDDKRRVLVRHKTWLSKLKPDLLPLNMGKNLGVLGAKYITDVVSEAVNELEKGHILTEVLEENKEDVRGKSGLKVAREMIADQEVRPAVLSLLSSLKDTHEGVETKQDYYQASEAGLKFIRDEFGLLQIPTMSELLIAATADLESTGSALATATELQHQGKGSDKNKVSRREKLEALCKEYLEKENLNSLLNGAKFNRGQTLSDGALAKHPHAYVLERFKSDDVNGVFDSSSLGTGRVTELGTVTDITPSTHGLMNNFLKGTPDGAALLINDVAQVKSIQLYNGQPKDVKFKYSSSGHWQVSLANKIWTVDPAFILDNPNLVIPFEGKESGEHRQDWIPLKNRSGETAVLVLKKVPGQVGFSLFEVRKGELDILVPMLIGRGEPHQEKVEAQFLYDAACFDSSASSNQKGSESIIELVQKLHGASPYWLKSMTAEALQGIYIKAKGKVDSVPVSSPIPVKLQNDFFNSQQITQSPAHQIAVKKRSKRIMQTAVNDNGVKAEHSSGKMEVYDSKLYPKATIAPTFEEMVNTFNTESQKSVPLKEKWLAGQQKDRDEFRNGAFKDLMAYHGCELDHNKEQSPSSEKLTEGTPEYAKMVLRKTMKVNRNHRMRLAQQLDADRKHLVEQLRKIEPEKMADYSDRDVLSMAIIDFEGGRIPEIIIKDSNQREYIQRLTRVILTQNDLEQSTRISSGQAGLMKQLDRLERDAPLLKSTNPSEYLRLCEKFNLAQAFLASDQDTTANLIDKLHEKTLNRACRAILSFQLSRNTLLRKNQVEEVNESLAQISEAMDTPGGTISRISQKGTGWGKSTIVQLLSDHACSHNLGHDERSVLVIAPVSNQAELDKVLKLYYAPKGRTYRSLNITRDYSDKDKDWWSKPENFDQIHNTLLGLKPNTKLKDRASAVSELRAPVGVSVKDIQILIQLRKALQSKERATDNEEILRKLDAIFDLVRKSMVFGDEWDSTLMPPIIDELKGITEDINKALRGLSTEVDMLDVVQSHGEMIFNCERKQLMSATTGSDYTESLVSGKIDAKAIKEACHTDPFTTQQRFFHWLSTAHLIYTDSASSGEDLDKKMIDEVVGIVGVDREVMVFDATQKEGKIQAVRDHENLTAAREARGGKSKGILFYDANKQLHMYLPGDARYGDKNGAIVPPEEERRLRETQGHNVDVSLGLAQSIGTDAPQNKGTVGILKGITGQDEVGQSRMLAQQVGRLKRAATDLRESQTLFVTFDEAHLESLKADEKFISDYKQVKGKAAISRDTFNRTKDSTGEWSAEQNKIIQGDLVFATPSIKPEGRSDLEKALSDEIERLSVGEWPKVFSREQIHALKQYKKDEWHKRASCLNVIAAEMAKRDVSPLVEECEDKLQAAKVNSYLDKAYSEEEAWLKSGMDGKLGDFTLPELSGGALASGSAKEFARQGMVTEGEKILSAIPRRVAEASVSVSQLEKQVKLDKVRESLEKSLDSIAGSGFELPEMNELDLPNKDYQKISGEMVTTREKLQFESIALHNKAIIVVENIIKEYNSGKPVGLSLLEEKKEELLVRIKLISDVSKDGVNGALDTEIYLQAFYQKVFTICNGIGFSVYTHSSSFNESALKKVAGHLLKAVSFEGNYQPKKISRGYDSSSSSSSSNNKNANAPSGIIREAVNKSKLEQHITGATYDALSWTLDTKTIYKKLNISPKPDYITSEELSKVVSKASAMKGVMDQHEAAKQFCQTPTSDEYKKCVDKMKVHISTEFSKRENLVVEKVKQAVNKLQEQEKFMQSKIKAS